MNGAYGVDWGDLREHGRHVTRQGETVELARKAAEHVHLGAAAYGELLQAIPGYFEEAHRSFIDAAGRLRDATAALGQRAGKAADEYEETEHGNRSAVSKIRIEPRWPR